MQFSVKRDVLLKSLTFVQGVVEKKNTLPILSNVLLILNEGKLKIVATDMDIVFYDEISDVKVEKEGSTTTSASVLYDILRKITNNSSVSFNLSNDNKLSIKADNADFNLLCLAPDNFPSFPEEFSSDIISINRDQFLSLLNKTRISISNDDTRHYLNGVFLHITSGNQQNFLTGVSTDSHRLSSCGLKIDSLNNFPSIILPKKTVYQLCSLLAENSKDVKVQTNENRIQFIFGNTKLISKVIDGKFPDYKKVVPTDNKKALVVPTKEFINSVERVTTVSSDKKEGVKLNVSKNCVKLSVTSANSGDGKEIIKADYNDDEITISFNSKYLIDIASQIEDERLKINFKDPVSPVLIEDYSDKNSYYVIMPMKI